ncbi:MAG TPA: glycosyltransferase 87 family protein [Thermoanaerobaculia bacterium]|nr:glycosyltransferase 87 family protein [Thermoanaerobaculia bacterium]
MERRRSLAEVLPVIAGFAGLLLVWDFEARPLGFLLLVAGTFVALWRFSRRRSEITLGVLLGVAALVRGLLLPVPLSLSDDVYRYLWDGRVVLAGFDPYRLAPEAPELEPLRDAVWERTAHREVQSVYPPLALTLFSIAAALPFDLFAWKGLMALFDLGSCWLLWVAARRTGRATGPVVWYAWNPLVVIESAGMGHLDAAGVCALLAGLVLLLAPGEGTGGPWRPSRPVLAGLAVAGAALIKLVPLVLLPLLLHRARSAAFAAALGAALVIGFAPMVAPSAGAPPGLVRYGVSWEFNGLAFEPLWRVIDRTGTAPAVKESLDLVRTRMARPERLEPLYPFVYPQLLAKVVLAAGLVWVVLIGLLPRDPLEAAAWTLGGALLLSATLYPWYALWALPLAALLRSPAWLVLSLSLQAAYLPRLFGWSAWPSAWLAVWAPFLGVAAWRLLRRARAANGGAAPA